MERVISRERLPLLLYCLLAVALPWPFRISAACVVAIAVVVPFCTDWRAQLRRLRSRRWLWPWLGYLALIVLALLWTADRADGLADVERKLSFLVFPLLLGAGPSVGRSGARAILLSFCAGMVAVGLYSFGQATGHYAATGSTDHFYYHQLVSGLQVNAVYMALYTFFALCILLFLPARMAREGAWRWPVLVFLFLYFAALSSRTLLLLFLLVPMPIYLLGQWRRRSARRHSLMASMVLFAAMTLGVLLNPKGIRQRYAETMTEHGSSPWLDDYRKDPQRFTSSTTRLFIWRVGVEVLVRHKLWLTGSGPGDMRGLTNARFSELGISEMAPGSAHPSHLQNVNMHNTYLQALVGLGIGGILLLLGVVVPPLAVRWKHPERVLWRMLAISAALFMMQEAVFQTQAGVIFLCFFTALFWNRYYGQRALVKRELC